MMPAPRARHQTPVQAPSLDIDVRLRPGSRVRLTVRGECDRTTAELLRAVVAAQIQAGRPDVQLHLSAVTACDRSGLRALVEARNDLLANHGQLLLLRPAACVTRLLRMTQLDQVMPILTEAALAACLAPDDEATSRRAEPRSDPYHNQPYPP